MATTDMAISANARSMRPRFRGIRRSSSASIPVRDSLSVHDPVGDADRRAGNRPCSRVELAVDLSRHAPGRLPRLVERIELRGAMEARKVDRQLRSEEHTSELQSRLHLVCRLLL